MRKGDKLVFGVGINDADYVTNSKIKVGDKWKSLPLCPYYVKWHSMIRRCYSEKALENRPTYKGCSVCEEWKYFSNFREWMIQQEWEGRQLDKDFLIENNKVYSPSTCVFLPQKINSFTNAYERRRGDYPIGTSFYKRNKKNPYQSYCTNGSGALSYLGYFSTPEQAHQAWLKKKFEICIDHLVEFKNEPLIIQGLSRIKNKIQHHIDTNKELTSF